MWILQLAAPSSACDLDTLDGHLAAADAAFVARDQEALLAAVAAADRELGCIRQVVPPLWSARVHFAHALAEWKDVDDGRCVASLRAAQHAEPLFRLPEEVIPPTHAMRRLAWEAEETPDAWTLSSRPARIDGLPSSALPVGQPYLLQKLTGAGGVRRVEPGGKAPGAERHTAGTLRWVSGGLGVAGLGLLVAAQTQRAAYYDDVLAGRVAEANDRHLYPTNNLSIAWAVTGGTAAALFGASFAF